MEGWAATICSISADQKTGESRGALRIGQQQCRNNSPVASAQQAVLSRPSYALRTRTCSKLRLVPKGCLLSVCTLKLANTCRRRCR